MEENLEKKDNQKKENAEEKNENTENNLKDTNIVDEKQAEIDELTDRYKRMMAEFENYKKRSAKDRENLYNSLIGDIVTSILPVVDNLEKAVDAKTEDEVYKDGVKLVQKQLLDILERYGVKTIETVGKTFDPSLHEAVSHIEDESKGEQEIVEEYRKGYTIGTKVIRHAMVSVAN